MSESIRQKSAVCKGCGKIIIYLPTVTNKMMPVDLDDNYKGEDRFIHGKHTSHFATCPEAAQFRRERTK